MTLKVRPIPEASALVWVPMPDVEGLGPALDRLNTSATRPMALELFNPTGARLAGEALEAPGRRLGRCVVGFEDNAASVAWQLDRLASELGRTDLVVLEAAEGRACSGQP